MKPLPPHLPLFLLRRALALLALVLASTGVSLAQESAARIGVITGRILNPATGEYLSNAVVSVVNGPSTTSGPGGNYRLPGVAVGDATVVVRFTGHPNLTATVGVSAGQTSTRDFQLTGNLGEPGADNTVKLDSFVVSSQREGNAKAIMEQRNSMNITNTVSADAYGDVAEGNVGEFLKNMPGVNFDSLDGTVRYISLRGLASEYAGVTVDGMNFPSADAGSASRAFSFEQVSLSSMESIEINKTIGADVDASSPAGTINLKTKRAFDRVGRRITASASLTGQSDHFTTGRTYSPGDDKTRKIFPSGQFEYSDVFLNNRLGIVFGISESNSFIQRAPTTMTYNYVPTAASPAPVALTAIRAQQVQQTVERFSTLLTADFKATPQLVLSLSIMYNHSDVWSGQRSAIFNTGARTTPVAGADPLTSFTTAATNASFQIEPQGIAKVGNGKSYLPRFEYNLGDLKVEGRFNISDSYSKYDPMGYRDSVFSPGVQTLSGVKFTAQRPAVNDGKWNIVQTGGSDWANGAFFTPAAVTLDDGRYGDEKLYSGETMVTLRTHKFLPITWKTGAKWKREKRNFENKRSASFYTYSGPGAGVGQWRDYRSGLNLDYSEQKLSTTSLSGGGLFLPDIMKIASTFRSNPGYFTPTMTGTDYYNAYIASHKKYQEDIDAQFVMATTKVGKINLRAGLRREGAETDSLEPDALSSAAVTAAGFPIAAGRATTIPGVKYQYESRPNIHRTNSYDYWFPSGSIKYNFTNNLDLQAGYSRTIKRPQFGDVSGVWLINDDALTVTAPNTRLKPEISNNYSIRLAKYFEPIGIVALNFFQNDVEGLHRAGTRVSAAEFDPSGAYNGYTFITTAQSPDKVRLRGMEVEYSQSLSFLPGAFKGLGIRANYTRNYAQVIVVDMTPHLVSAGLTYSYRRFNLNTNVNWASNRPTLANGTLVQRHRLNLDLGGSYRFSQNWSLFYSVRNVLNTPFIRMEQVGNNPSLAQFYQKFGITPTLGVKATF